MSKRAKEGELNERQERFCEEYLIDLNATRAAIRAGYAESGAHVEGSRLLSNPKVIERVQALKDERTKRTQLTADQVLAELAAIGFAKLDAQSLIDQMSRLMEKGIDPRSMARPGYPDKLRALELLGKHLKLFTEKHEHSGPNGGAIPLSNLTDAELEARYRETLAKALGKPEVK